MHEWYMVSAARGKWFKLTEHGELFFIIFMEMIKVPSKTQTLS